jgi:hypothetical protein
MKKDTISPKNTPTTLYSPWPERRLSETASGRPDLSLAATGQEG